MKDDKTKKQKPGEVSAQGQTYTIEQINAMTDAEVAELAAPYIEGGTRPQQVAALEANGIIIHGSA